MALDASKNNRTVEKFYLEYVYGDAFETTNVETIRVILAMNIALLDTVSKRSINIAKKNVTQYLDMSDSYLHKIHQSKLKEIHIDLLNKK